MTNTPLKRAAKRFVVDVTNCGSDEMEFELVVFEKAHGSQHPHILYVLPHSDLNFLPKVRRKRVAVHIACFVDGRNVQHWIKRFGVYDLEARADVRRES